MSIGDIALERIEGPLYQQTEQIIEPYLIHFANELRKWLSKAHRAMSQLETVKTALEKNGKEALKNLKDFGNWYKLTYTKSNMVNEDARRIILEGYQLLNYIGETFRGDTINYRIVVTSKGDIISQSVENGADVYSFVVPMKKFLDFLTGQTYALQLQKTSTIYNWLSNKKNKYIGKNGQVLSKGVNEIALEQWSEEKKQMFNVFADQARHVIEAKPGDNRYKPWEKVNEGNLLEAYYRFLNGNGVVQRGNTANSYWADILTVMRATMKNPDPFYMGGDIGQEQLKGISASAVNLGTIITASYDILKVLQFNKSVFDNVIGNTIRAENKDNIEAKANKTVEQTVEGLKKLLISEVDRNFVATIQI